MEFKFRAVDERPPSFLSPSSTTSSFSYQSFTAGYSSPIPTPKTSQMGNPNNAREAILRQLEKEQIRREVIAAEIVRRQMLEEEVRREVMLERELAMRRNMDEEFLLQEQIAMRLSPSFPMMHPLNNLPFEERIAFPGSSTMHVFPLPHVPQVRAPEIKPCPETNKNRLIILAKPDPDHYRAKRKAIESPAVDGNEFSPFGLKKKPKDEWSCALCQVSATSQKGLNEHLQGRKHKAKEAALRTQKIDKSNSTSLLSKKSEKSLKPTETIPITTSGLETKADGQPLQSEVALKGITKEVDEKDLVEIKNEEQLLQKKQNAKGSKKQNTKGQGIKRPDELKRKQKLKFWCEVCQVGVPSQVVMESHRKGRKHMARLLAFSKTKGIVPVSSAVSSETTELTKEADCVNVPTKETTVQMADNSANSDKTSESPVAENSDKSFVSPVAESSGYKEAEEL